MSRPDPLQPGTVPPVPAAGNKKGSRVQNTPSASPDAGVDEFVTADSTQRSQARESVVRSFGLSDEAAALLRNAVNERNPLA